MEKHLLSLSGYENLLGRLKKLNKRGKKLGLEDIEPKNVRKYSEVEKEDGEEVIRTYVEFELEESTPYIDGYKIVAVLERVGEKNVIRRVITERNEEHDLTSYVSRVTCDHCNHKRNRKHTYILADEKGKYVQVGRTCLQDYLEGDTKYIVMLSTIDFEQLEEEAKERNYGQLSIDLETFLSMTIEHVNRNGYFNSQTIDPTGYQVWLNFFPNHTEHKKYSIEAVKEKNLEESQEIIKWAKEQEESGNEYLRNLGVIAQEGLVTTSLIGYASSMVVSYRRNLEEPKEVKKDLLKEEERPQVESTYVGEIGERLESILTVESIYSFDSQYGEVNLIILTDLEGNEYKWTTTSNHKLEKGETYKVKFSIKDHKEYREKKQTVITRLKIQAE